MKRLVYALGLAVGALLASIAHAQMSDTSTLQDISTYATLPCAGRCPEFVPAKKINDTIFGFRTPKKQGIVDVSFTIGTDGRVKNPIIVRMIGAQDAPDLILDALHNYFWYRPATEDGKPVEENRQQRFFIGISFQVHPEVSSMYSDALAKGSDPNAQMVALRAIYAQPNLSLYEIAMIAAALARIETSTGDYVKALEDIRTAALGDGRLVDKSERENILRLKIALEARAGQYADAFATFETLKSVVHHFPDDDPTEQMITHLHAQVDSAKALWMDGAIPSDQTFWIHTMVRRSFGFAKVKGTLTKFSCVARRTASSHPCRSRLHGPFRRVGASA